MKHTQLCHLPIHVLLILLPPHFRTCWLVSNKICRGKGLSVSASRPNKKLAANGEQDPNSRAPLREGGFHLFPVPVLPGRERTLHTQLKSSHLLEDSGHKCVDLISTFPFERLCSHLAIQNRDAKEDKITSKICSNEHISVMMAHRRAGLCCQLNVTLFYHCQERRLHPAQFSLPEMPACFPKDALVLIRQDTNIKIWQHLAKNKMDLSQKRNHGPVLSKSQRNRPVARWR